MSYDHHLNWLNLNDKSVSEYFDSRGFKKFDISSRDFNAIGQEQFKRWKYPDMQLASVYRKIAEYSDKFTLFTKTTNDIVYLPHEKFIGKPHEAPVPLVQMISSSSSEHYFYPKDRKFIGRFGRQFEILDLAMPYVSMVIWEQGSFSSGEGRLHIQAQIELEYWLGIADKKYATKLPKLTRPEIIGNLEFLLSFIPQERSIVIDQNLLPKKRSVMTCDT